MTKRLTGLPLSTRSSGCLAATMIGLSDLPLFADSSGCLAVTMIGFRLLAPSGLPSDLMRVVVLGAGLGLLVLGRLSGCCSVLLAGLGALLFSGLSGGSTVMGRLSGRSMDVALSAFLIVLLLPLADDISLDRLRGRDCSWEPACLVGDKDMVSGELQELEMDLFNSACVDALPLVWLALAMSQGW